MNSGLAKGLLGGLVCVAIAVAGTYFFLRPPEETKTAAGLKMLDSFVGKLPPEMRFEYAGAEANQQGEVTARDVVISGHRIGSVAIRELLLRDYDTENKVPYRVDMALRGVELPLHSAKPEARRAIADLGYDRLELNVDYAYLYSPRDQRLDLAELRMDVPGAGALIVRARLGNLATVDMGDEKLALKALLDMVIRGGELIYRDHSLVGRVIRYRAEKKGVGEAEYREQILARIDLEIGETTDELLRDALRTIRSFIENPGEIRLTIAPDEPVGALQLMLLQSDPEEASRLLGLGISAN